MGRFVIVAYTPKPGKEEQLLAVVKKHLDVLAAENLITDRPGYVMRAVDGSIVEVFEWRSAEAIAQAHTNAAVGGTMGRVRRGLRLHAAGSVEGITADVCRIRCHSALTFGHAAAWHARQAGPC